MSVVMGPDDTNASDVNLLARLSATVLGGTVPVVNGMGRLIGSDTHYRFDRQSLRLAIHGESENAGDAFERGQMVGGFLAVNHFAALFIAVVVGFSLVGLANLLGEPAARPLAWLCLLVYLGVWGVIGGTYWLADAISVVDHTTEPQPEALEELQTAYTDGEIDESELADAVEEVIER